MNKSCRCVCCFRSYYWGLACAARTSRMRKESGTEIPWFGLRHVPNAWLAYKGAPAARRGSYLTKIGPALFAS